MDEDIKEYECDRCCQDFERGELKSFNNKWLCIKCIEVESGLSSQSLDSGGSAIIIGSSATAIYPDLIELAEITDRHRNWRKRMEEQRRQRALAYERTTRKSKLKAAIKLTVVFVAIVIVWVIYG